MRGELRATRDPERGFHEYDVESRCRVSVCSRQDVERELRNQPAPGTKTGDTTDIPILGRVRHLSESSSTLNITLDGEHRLAPGVVSRRVVEEGNYVYIRTYGLGFGAAPLANEAFAPALWKAQDRLIFGRAASTANIGAGK